MKARYIYYGLYLFVPLAFAAEFSHNDKLTFVFSVLGIIPLAGLLGEMTETIAHKIGSTAGGLLNATLGNAAELIIGIMALSKGEIEVVQGSIAGSVIANVLLVIGFAMFCGGLKRQEQSFSQVASESGIAMLFVSCIAFIIPSMFAGFNKNILEHADQASMVICGILIATYVAGIIFSMFTHRKLLEEEEEEIKEDQQYSTKRAVFFLILSAGLIGVLSEFLTGSVGKACVELKLSPTFAGLVIVAIAGNAAEHGVAVLLAMKNRMNLAMNVAMESSKQIAILVAPVLVFASHFVGPRPMTIFLDLPLVVAILVSTITLAIVALNGKSNWLEGFLLIAAYAIMGTAFYFE